jgi:predicted ester cyclase
MKRTIRLNRDLFPDLHIAVQDQVAERDRVATRWTGSMTHAATGNAVMITGITIDRFENGRIVEAWRSMDMLAMLRGIGAIAKS